MSRTATRPLNPHAIGSECGQSTAEFALVAPVLFTLIWGIMIFGISYGKMLDLQSAVREGARKASISVDSADPVGDSEQAVLNATSLIDDDDVAVTVTPAPSPPWEHGDQITVRAESPYTLNLMGMTLWDGNLTAEAEVRAE